MAERRWWAARASRLIGVPLLVLLVAACRGPGTSVAPGSTTQEPSGSVAPITQPPTASPSPLVSLPTPGRPYDASAVLDAMAASTRPGGVPAVLQTDAIAAAVAEQLWTFDGSAWEQMAAGGSCGSDRCTLEISGSAPDAAGEDHYILDVVPADGSVTVSATELRALPQPLVDELDQLARDRWPDAPLPGPLASVRWQPPPDANLFVLSYRSGGEEGSPAVDAVLDIATGSLELREPGSGG